MTATGFSSSESAALERQVETEDMPMRLEEIWSEPHKKICSGWLRKNAFKRVCLQFPDDYLPHSNAISENIKTLATNGLVANIKVFILADTSYGSCCVDEVAAEHIDADSIIHFGNACRSKISRLPVLYVFPHLTIDLQTFYLNLEKLKGTCNDRELYVYFDIGYHHVLERKLQEDTEIIRDKIRQIIQCKTVHVKTYPTVEDVKSDCETRCERICLFVGGDNNRFFNLSVTTKAVQWFVYDSICNTLKEKNPLTTNYIRRRYYYIEKCKDAKTLGLIVATLSAEGYLDVVERLQEMAKSRGIKTQIISVGRINPAKLANFLEIDCFVLIGCPFNDIYNSKEFYKPIVSVFEAEMALNSGWYMKYPEVYVTDFTRLLPGGPSFVEFGLKPLPENDVSLITGRLRYDATHMVALDDLSASREQQKQLIPQPKMEVMTSNGGLTFEDRTWKGLDPSLGCNEPAKIKKGLSGIPIKYSHD